MKMWVLQWQIVHMGKRWMSWWENLPQKKSREIGSGAKGQLISEWLSVVLNFPKKTTQKLGRISSLESKKGSNQKDKGTLLC